MEGGASDAGDGGELVGGAAARRRPDHREPGRLVGLVEDAEGGGLAGAGDADDADDPVGSQGGLADERPLLAGERRPPLSARRRIVSSTHGASVPRPARASSSAARSTSSSSRVVKRAGRPGLSSGLRSSMPGRRTSSSAVSSTCSTVPPSRSEPATAQTSSGIVKVVCFSASPSRANRSVASCSRSSSARSLTVQVDQVAQLAPAEAVLGRARLPLLAQPRQVDLFLRLAGGERGDAGGDEAFRAVRLHVLDERLPPRRERPHCFLRYGLEVGHSLHRLGPAEAEPPGDLVAQLRLVEVAGGEPVGLQDRLAVERPPLPVRRTSHVGDDHVGVQVRILRPAGAVSEGRSDEALRVLADRAGVAAADDARLALEVGERRLPGRLVRLAQLAADALVVGQRMQQADALRAREDKVVARHGREPLLLLPPLAGLGVQRAHGDRPLAHRRPQPGVARGVDTAKERPQVALANDPEEPKPFSVAPSPDPRRLTATGVVVVQSRPRPAARSRPPAPASASPHSARRHPSQPPRGRDAYAPQVRAQFRVYSLSNAS